MKWIVRFEEKFDEEFDELGAKVQDELLSHAALLEAFGPQLGRPFVDTLKGSKHSNMKELRFKAGRGVWRVAFAYDPKRQAILLIAGNKAGVSQTRFYKELIKKADERFTKYLSNAKKGKLHD
tara:strand:- start:1167 stop:1535 length:369 start_codon:yes stop_codon:yes gene_type:complete